MYLGGLQGIPLPASIWYLPDGYPARLIPLRYSDQMSGVAQETVLMSHLGIDYMHQFSLFVMIRNSQFAVVGAISKQSSGCL